MTGRFFIDPTMIDAEPDGIEASYAGIEASYARIESVPGGIDIDPLESH